MSYKYRHNFLLPFFAAGWGVPLSEMKNFTAYNVMKTIAGNLKPAKGSRPFYPPIWNEVKGGMGAYISKVKNSFLGVDVKTSVSIENVRFDGKEYTIKDSRGRKSTYDIVVIATNANDAARLTRHLPDLKDVRELMAKVRYYTSTLVFHGNAEYMPANTKDWSIMNVRYNGHVAGATEYKPWLSSPSQPVFKSWLMEGLDTDLSPSPEYARITFRHPIIDKRYYDAQAAVEKVQGLNQLYFIGVQTVRDINNHEVTAISAKNLVERLHPNSERLKAWKSLL